MKVRTHDPYSSNAQYKLKGENLLALHPNQAKKVAKKAQRKIAGLPGLDERFIKQRSYETKCSGVRKILSIFTSLLLLPLFSKNIRLAMKGKKIVTSHTFSTQKERLELKASYRFRGTLFDDTLKNTRELLISEEFSLFKTNYDTKVKSYTENCNKAHSTQDEEVIKAMIEANTALTEEMLTLSKNMLAKIQQRQAEALRVKGDKSLLPSPVILEIEHELNRLVEARISKKQFGEMSDTNKRLWNLSKKVAPMSRVFAGSLPRLWYIAMKFDHKEDFLKDLYKSFPSQAMQVALTQKGISV